MTYTKPVLGQDAAGFFVQGEAAGPAIFVAVDPASLSPVPQVGDKVTFTVTDLATASGLREVTGISGLAVSSSGNDIAPLVTDVTAATDVITALDTYESRAIKVSGTIASDFVTAGSPQVSAQLNTTGVQDANFALRLPESIRAQYDLQNGCAVTVNVGVMWRFTAKAQPSVYDALDLTAMTCPAPTVAGATATSASEVLIQFDRTLDPATVDAADFVFDNGLTATAVSVNGSDVTVTTTAQTGGTTYTVTVSNLTDVLGSDIGQPNTTQFTGFSSPAKLLINEINPNISGGHDLVELLVTEGGSTTGIRLVQVGSATDLLATLPDMNVATGDIIVVHLVPTGTTGIAPASETTAKNEYAAATYTANYDGAWDVLGGTTGLTYSHRVIELLTAGDLFVDAVPFVLSTSGSPPSAFPGALQALQAAGEWLPADCGGALCTYTSTPTAVSVSVDYLGCGNSATGNSVQRKPGTDTMQNSDWNTAAAQSFGASNP